MYSDEARQISGFVVVFLVLSAGALLSVLANLLLPGAARRLKVKEELAIISRKVADLSMNLDSRLRVPLGVERARLSRSLEELGTVSPDFSTAIAQIDKDVAGLTTRLDILERMELVSRRYWKMRREGRLPMSLTQEIDDLRQQATDVLARSEPKDTDLQNAQLLIQEIEKRIANIDQPNPAFAQQLVSRFQKLQTDLSTVAINNSKILQDLRSDLPDLFTRLTMNLPKAEEIKPADYVDLDTMVFQLAFVNRYNALLRSPLDSKQEQRLKDNRSKLLVLLRQPGWDSLNQARSLIQQLEENVFPEDVLEAVSDNRVEIDADLNQVYQFESVGFRLFFLDKRIASSTAGREFTCKWDFGHDNLSERGGWVSHYFPYPTILTSVMAWKQIIWRLVASSILVFLVLGVPLTWLVGGLKSPIWSLLLADLISLLLTALAIALSPWGRTVRFAIKKKRNPNLASRDADPRYLGPPYLMKASLTTPDGGNTVVVTHSLEVYKTPRTRLPASFWVEVTRITIALLIALAGLVTGAKEQLLKLDVFPALVAIFMIGFGANEVKKLFSQNPQA
jgi:hypothetical protein